MGSEIYTIGYAGFPDIDEFIKVLKSYGITTLLDARSRPYLAYFEQYAEDNLRNALTKEDLAYIKFEDEFGLEPAGNLDDSDEMPDFELIAETESFQNGISRVRFGLEKGLVPVILGEAMDPMMCHRGLLIGRVLHDLGYKVMHIIPGGLKDHSELEREIIEFARENTDNGNEVQEQLSLIPSDGETHAAVKNEDLLVEGYRLLNRMLY